MIYFWTVYSKEIPYLWVIVIYPLIESTVLDASTK